MPCLARRFLFFVLALGVAFSFVYVSYRCGYSEGFHDAPRQRFSADLSNQLKTDPLFREYVIGIYGREFRMAIDSMLRAPSTEKMIREWLDNSAPLCRGASRDTVPLRQLDKGTAERIFFGGVK